MYKLFDVELLLLRQLVEVAKWHQGHFLQGGDPSFENLVSAQHHTNFELWHEEDQARNPTASDSQLFNPARSCRFAQG